ncbi:unnamed protein product, partial [Heterosigma akashiwo]
MFGLLLRQWSCFSHEPLHSPSTVYSNACIDRGRSYWDYANFDLENQENFWRDPDDFRILKEIGNGKFGTVFEGVDCRPPGAAPGKGRRVVLKRLAAGAREDRLRREVR